uniref:Uncharacterized protein n=1 Tax=Arundo donax TaxID=35708 RepID=A0A0A8Z475_ARUDO
MYNLSCSGFC